MPRDRACWGHVSVWQITWAQSVKQFHVALHLRAFESTQMPYVIKSECATYYNIAENAVQVQGGSQVNYVKVRFTSHVKPMCPESQSGTASNSYVSRCCDRYADI